MIQRFGRAAQVGKHAAGSQVAGTGICLVINIDTPDPSAHVTDIDAIGITVLVYVNDFQVRGDTIGHIRQNQIGGGVGRGPPQALTGCCIDNIDGTADIIGLRNFRPVLIGIIAATEDQHIAIDQAAAIRELDLGHDRA